jgi:hypothetical protein
VPYGLTRVPKPTLDDKRFGRLKIAKDPKDPNNLTIRSSSRSGQEAVKKRSGLLGPLLRGVPSLPKRARR